VDKRQVAFVGRHARLRNVGVRQARLIFQEGLPVATPESRVVAARAQHFSSGDSTAGRHAAVASLCATLDERLPTLTA